MVDRTSSKHVERGVSKYKGRGSARNLYLLTCLSNNFSYTESNHLIHIMHLSHMILILVSAALVAVPTSARGTNCTDSVALDGVYTSRDVDMGSDPLTHFDAPQLSDFNASAIEDWSFDGVSRDGSAGMSFFFSRGTVAGHVAAQRLFLSVVWPNGTRYMESVFVRKSSVRQCRGSTIAHWTDDATRVRWTFASSVNYQNTVVTIDSPAVKGTYTIKALTPAVYPNGLEYPSADGDPLFAPELYWEESVPVGTVEANLSILGTPFVLSGYGGREKNWNSEAWADISADWDMMRAAVGPYAFIVWRYTSQVDRNTYFSVVLFKNRQVIFRTANLGASDPDGKTYGSVASTNTGPVHLSSAPGSRLPLPESRFTGYVLDFVSPETEQRWKFALDFTRTVYWFPASSALRIGGFVGNVTGGLVGGEQYTGLASGSAQEVVI
ncbi:hypothetical protein B0H67DRAFT_569793 [Lasiosphaeris hirsuta]|uniref:Diels-Alderase n=1 Tax=Lasiosphaeris hirsuta TaxID=260670 RepID=A0AA40E4W6_9PEZI|nr:hypothetical protein B0H67DRAFT_569793 [Lasiosphaeris hirsuta]